MFTIVIPAYNEQLSLKNENFITSLKNELIKAILETMKLLLLMMVHQMKLLKF